VCAFLETGWSGVLGLAQNFCFAKFRENFAKIFVLLFAKMINDFHEISQNFCENFYEKFSRKLCKSFIKDD